MTADAEMRPVAGPGAGAAFQPRTLLAITLYCHLHEIYGAHDIEDALRRDVKFRALYGREFPGALLLRRFRRQNRELLQHALAEALERLHPSTMPQAVAAEEARRRIGIAMFIDNMESAA